MPSGIVVNLLPLLQNYFGDPWNAFDFVIVLGSLIDIGMAQLNVSVRSQMRHFVVFATNASSSLFRTIFETRGTPSIL